MTEIEGLSRGIKALKATGAAEDKNAAGVLAELRHWLCVQAEETAARITRQKSDERRGA